MTYTVVAHFTGALYGKQKAEWECAVTTLPTVLDTIKHLTHNPDLKRLVTLTVQEKDQTK